MERCVVQIGHLIISPQVGDVVGDGARSEALGSQVLDIPAHMVKIDAFIIYFGLGSEGSVGIMPRNPAVAGFLSH